MMTNHTKLVGILAVLVVALLLAVIDAKVLHRGLARRQGGVKDPPKGTQTVEENVRPYPTINERPNGLRIYPEDIAKMAELAIYRSMPWVAAACGNQPYNRIQLGDIYGANILDYYAEFNCSMVGIIGRIKYPHIITFRYDYGAYEMDTRSIVCYDLK